MELGHPALQVVLDRTATNRIAVLVESTSDRSRLIFCTSREGYHKDGSCYCVLRDQIDRFNSWTNDGSTFSRDSHFSILNVIDAAPDVPLSCIGSIPSPTTLIHGPNGPMISDPFERFIEIAQMADTGGLIRSQELHQYIGVLVSDKGTQLGIQVNGETCTLLRRNPNFKLEALPMCASNIGKSIIFYGVRRGNQIIVSHWAKS